MNRIYFLIIISLLFLCSSCQSISKETYTQNMKSDKILYDKAQEKDKKIFPSKTINIYNGQELIGTISLGKEQVSLYFVSKNGTAKELWRYYDYRGVDKITQSSDSYIIRIYYWESLIAGLFGTKEYVMEFYINSMSKKFYRLTI